MEQEYTNLLTGINIDKDLVSSLVAETIVSQVTNEFFKQPDRFTDTDNAISRVVQDMGLSKETAALYIKWYNSHQ